MENFLNKFSQWLENRAVHRIYREEELYLERWFIFRSKFFHILLHKFHCSDSGLHTHPWANISVPLSSGMREYHIDGTYTNLPRFKPYFRQAKQPHRVEIERESWTIFIYFRRRFNWGFITYSEFEWYNGLPSVLELKGYVFPRRAEAETSTLDQRFSKEGADGESSGVSNN